MTRAEQQQFVDELITGIHFALNAKMDRIPDDWDGHELRQWIADTFQYNATLERKSRRYRAYQKAVITHNL